MSAPAGVGTPPVAARAAYWQRVLAAGCPVPGDARLDDLTTELVSMLGSPDRQVREDLAFAVLRAWVAGGVYDHLLAGLGDGLVAGLRFRIGERGTDSVLRRSWSARALAAVVARDNAARVVHPQQLLRWADPALEWCLAERDLRGRLPGRGTAGARAHGAYLLAQLAASRHLAADELALLLDVVAQRLRIPTPDRPETGDDDRLAFAVLSVLHRDLLPMERCERWLEALAAGWRVPADDGVRADSVALLRAVHLQLLLGVTGCPSQDPHTPGPPAVRADLLLALQDLIREAAPDVFRPHR